MSQHDELLSKINELNIVRESNATLRMECDRLTNNASSLEVLVASLRHEIEPLKGTPSLIELPLMTLLIRTIVYKTG